MTKNFLARREANLLVPNEITLLGYSESTISIRFTYTFSTFI